MILRRLRRLLGRRRRADTVPLTVAEIGGLLRTLRGAGLHPDAEELADCLWLAARTAPAPSGGDRAAPARRQSRARPSAEEKPSPSDSADPGRTRTDAAPRRQQTETPPAGARLLPAGAAGQGNRAAAPIRAPRARPLPDALALGRALRPLHRRLPSRRHRRIDEDATVARFAEQGIAGQTLLHPVLRPDREPWFELLLVVDTASSMLVWQPLLAELRRLLAYNGAFSRVRRLDLATRAADAWLHHPARPAPTQAIDPAALPGPPGRRMTLVVSDCVARAWHTGAALRTLAPLAAHGPLALVQLLPPRLWPDTALGYGTATRIDRSTRRPIRTPMGTSFLLPVLNLESSALADWARLSIGQGAGLDAVAFDADSAFLSPDAVPLDSANAAVVEGRLRRFLDEASPRAKQLAGLAAAVPITLDVLRLVQQTRLRDSGQTHLAELFVSGLLRRDPDPRPVESGRGDLVGLGTEPLFDFHPGVRRALLDLSSPNASLQLLRDVSRWTGHRMGAALDFRALLELPDGPGAAAAFADLARAVDDRHTRHFASIAAAVLGRLGGRWARIAAGLAALGDGDRAEARRIGAEIAADIDSTRREDAPSMPQTPTPFRDGYRDGSEGPEMVWLPGGTFTMGSPDGVGQDREHPAHAVKLSHYAVGRYPVTVGEFRRFVEATGHVTEAEQGDGAYVWNQGNPGQKEDASWRNPYMDQDDTHPVICISWNDAKAYCDWLSEQTGQPYGLLTEAQWEHACRAGEQGKWCFGDNEDELNDYAWYSRSSGDGTHPVGTKRPNAWELHDMHGNVWEWCADWFGENTYRERAARLGEAAESRSDSRGEAAAAYIVDPTGPETGSDRVVRGGSWDYGADYCRSACRDSGHPSGRYDDLGFRLSRTGPLHSYPFTLGGETKAPAYQDGLHDPLQDDGEGPAMVWLRGGRFTMGQDDSQWDNEKPAHPVEVSAFSVGQYPLTFDEYDRFCEATKRDKPDDEGWGRGRRPVINISWDDAQAYCDWLNAQQQTGTYRLLTEAEWEFACRAGSETRWSHGDDEGQLGDYAWYDENAGSKTHPVGEKKPNAWQLHDMHGNVWEWCADWFDDNTYSERVARISEAAGSRGERRGDSRGEVAAARIYDPKGPDTGSRRVVRGGSWGIDADICRSAYRDRRHPSLRNCDLGFRLSRTGRWPSYPFTLGRDDEGAPEQRGEAAEPKTPQAETFEPQQGFRDRFVILRKDGRAEPAGSELRGPEMVYLPGGTFLMGDEHGHDDEKPVHRVALDAFAIGRTPVTWGEYRRFCEDMDSHWPEWLEEGSKYHLNAGSNDYYTTCGVARDALDLPVVGVSRDDAVAYCAWLAERTDRPYRLPTEAEWEYACRAGTETRRSFGDDEEALDDHGWYAANARGKLHPVGRKRPNPWGLLDMHGNVWEWCEDWFDANTYKQRAVPTRRAAASRGDSRGEAAAVVISPNGPSAGSRRVVRGGSWGVDADGCRSAYRGSRRPSIRDRSLGFRLSRTV